MKRIIQSTVSLVLAFVFLVCLASCSGAGQNETPETTADDGSILTTEAQVDSDTEFETQAEIPANGVWQNATYRKDTEFGSGAKTAVVQVKAEDQIVTFTIKTDKDTVGAALLEHGLIAGEEGQFGLYVKVVNGMTADYDVDQSYWAVYVNGEYAMTGIDSTDIVEGNTYQLAYTKG